jgi:phytoene desaturase
MTVEGRRACVIGAGLGGLATAIRLQAAGVATTVLEARDLSADGSGSDEDGFTFDAEPGLLVDPGGLAELWQVAGGSLAEDIELLAVDPVCRFSWPDGATLELTRDADRMRREIARFERHNHLGYDAFLHHAERLRAELLPALAGPTPSLRTTLPDFIKLRAWRSPYAVAGRFVRDERLRQALSARTLDVGGNPLTASSLPLALVGFEHAGGAWCVRGGSHRLAAALARLFERLGGELRSNDAAVRIGVDGRRAHEVEARSGWRGRFDAIVSSADPIHTRRDLLGRPARKLMARRFGPGRFTLHLGLAGAWPGIPHRTLLLGDRFEPMLADVFERGVLPGDCLIDLHHPSVTDPSLAPDGASVFTATMPVPHLGKLAVDWQQVGPMLEHRIIDEIGRRLIPDIHDRILARRQRTPRDAASAGNRHLGSVFGPEPTVTQSGPFRPHGRDAAVRNLHYVGAGARPGEGLPGMLAGARTTAELIVRELAA